MTFGTPAKLDTHRATQHGCVINVFLYQTEPLRQRETQARRVLGHTTDSTIVDPCHEAYKRACQPDLLALTKDPWAPTTLVMSRRGFPYRVLEVSWKDLESADVRRKLRTINRHHPFALEELDALDTRFGVTTTGPDTAVATPADTATAIDPDPSSSVQVPGPMPLVLRAVTPAVPLPPPSPSFVPHDYPIASTSSTDPYASVHNAPSTSGSGGFSQNAYSPHYFATDYISPQQEQHPILPHHVLDRYGGSQDTEDTAYRSRYNPYIPSSRYHSRFERSPSPPPRGLTGSFAYPSHYEPSFYPSDFYKPDLPISYPLSNVRSWSPPSGRSDCTASSIERPKLTSDELQKLQPWFRTVLSEDD